ncbi:MAG TPA: DUF1801 domain-containing protein [Candidatus Nanopelagicales bacterium]
MTTTSVEDYLAALPDAPRAALEDLRATLLGLVPDGVETISYGMPTVKLRGKLLLSYAAFAKHCSLFPASGEVMAALGDELAPYFAEKATLRFAPTDPIPRELVERIVAIRVAEVSAS